MEILGSGLIATSLRPFETAAPDALVFARGVADSSTSDHARFARECAMLDEALSRATIEDRRLVYFSGGGAIYGPRMGLRDESTELRPTTPYGHHNLAMERRIQDHGGRYLIVRLANLLGSPQHPSQLVPALVRQALAGRATLQRAATRDILDAADAARLVTALLQVGRDRDVVIVARGRPVDVPSLFERIADIMGTRPAVALLERGESHQFDIGRLLERLGKTEDELGVASLEDALRRHVPKLAAAAGDVVG